MPVPVSLRFAIPANVPVRFVIEPAFEPVTVQVAPVAISVPPVVSLRLAIPANVPVRFVTEPVLEPVIV